MIMYFKRILSQQNFDVFTACSEIISSTNSFQSFSNRPNDSSQLLTFWLLNFPVSISNTWCMKSANVYIPSGCICCRLKNVYFPFRPVFFWWRTCMVLIQTDYEVKVPYHWRRHRVFLDCLIHFLQIPIRTAMYGWKLKFSGLIDGWSYLNVCTGFLLLGSMDRILGQHV